MSVAEKLPVAVSFQVPRPDTVLRVAEASGRFWGSNSASATIVSRENTSGRGGGAFYVSGHGVFGSEKSPGRSLF